MPVAYESVDTVDETTAGTTVIFTKPDGTVEGDLLLAIYCHTGWNSAWTWSNTHSFTELYDEVYIPDSNGCDFGAAWKIAGDSEPDNYTFTNAGSRPQRKGAMLRFSGVDTVSPINAEDMAKVTHATLITCPTVTTNVDGCLIVRLSASQPDGTPSTFVAPAGYTERADITGSNTAVSAHTIDTNQAVAGATGTAAITKTGWSGSQRDFALTVAIAPAAVVAAGGGPTGLDYSYQWGW